jgi:hypothetical protein
MLALVHPYRDVSPPIAGNPGDSRVGKTRSCGNVELQADVSGFGGSVAEGGPSPPTQIAACIVLVAPGRVCWSSWQQQHRPHGSL